METRECYIVSFNGNVFIGQGFNSKHTHRAFPEFGIDASYSLDFPLAEGTPIIAAREGIVTLVKDDSSLNYSGLDPTTGNEAAKQTNLIEICHKDGTFASYHHIQQNGAQVVVGQEVKQSTPIALSGNTGWSTQPHLHFMVYEKNSGGLIVKTIPIRFSNFQGPLEDRVINAHLYQ